jgi:hypothetical protein
MAPGHVWVGAAGPAPPGLVATTILTYLASRLYWHPRENELSLSADWLNAPYLLLWIAAYISLALGGRVVAARIIGVLNVALIGALIVLAIIVSSGFSPAHLIIALAWPVIWTLLLFAVSDSARPRRSLWLGVYLAASLALVPAAALSYGRYRSWLWVVEVPLVWRLTLLIGMVIVLAVPSLRRSPGWLLAFAIADSLFTAAAMLIPNASVLRVGNPPGAVDLVLLGLGVVCAIVGGKGLRRLPRTVPGST